MLRRFGENLAVKGVPGRRGGCVREPFNGFVGIWPPAAGRTGVGRAHTSSPTAPEGAAPRGTRSSSWAGNRVIELSAALGIRGIAEPADGAATIAGEQPAIRLVERRHVKLKRRRD